MQGWAGTVKFMNKSVSSPQGTLRAQRDSLEGQVQYLANLLEVKNMQIETLKETNAKLSFENKALKTTVKNQGKQIQTLIQNKEKQNQDMVELKAQVAALASKHQVGAHTPPSIKPANTRPYPTRETSGRKPGGQTGNPGFTLKRRTPDKTINLIPVTCSVCEENLESKPDVSTSIRQSISLNVTVEATDYVSHRRRCSNGHLTTPRFPRHVSNNVVYSPQVKAAAMLIHVSGLLPVEASCGILNAVTGLSVSTGTLSSWMVEAGGLLEGFDATLVSKLKQVPGLYVDETPVKTVEHGQKVSRFIHVACNENITRFHAGTRSKESVCAGGVVGNHTGVLISDGYATYSGLAHAGQQWCLAHLIREARQAP